MINAGIDVDNVTNWGHDATADGAFYTYYNAGVVTNVSSKNVMADTNAAWQPTWPKHEWEFRLDLDNGDEEAWTPIARWTASNALELDMAYQGAGISGAYISGVPCLT